MNSSHVSFPITGVRLGFTSLSYITVLKLLYLKKNASRHSGRGEVCSGRHLESAETWVEHPKSQCAAHSLAFLPGGCMFDL